MWLLLLMSIGSGAVTVDRAEVNTVYKSDGTLQFTQVILWRWQDGPQGRRYYVSQWQIIDGDRWKLDRSGGCKSLSWISKGKRYRVHCRAFVPPRRTMTDYEIADRDVMPQEWRTPYPIEPQR